MTPEERSAQLEAYAGGYAQLAQALAQLPRVMWSYRPAPREWSVNEIIAHLADNELNMTVRCRRCIAEPGKTVLPYDQEAWAAHLRYQDSDPDDALQLIRLLRQSTYKLLHALPEPAWASTYEHPERGTTTLETWLANAVRHMQTHIAQIQSTFERYDV
jgi:hypothetical protein